MTWGAPSDGGSPLTRFDVSTDGGRTWVAVDAGLRSRVVTGLVNGRTYSVQVRAVNAAGTGRATSSLTGTPALVPAAPTGLTATPGRRSLAVKFTAPNNGGSSITAYEYSLDGGTTWTRRTTSATATSFTINNLNAGTTYRVAVRAVNRVGTGPSSTVVTATPAPDPPPCP